MQHVYVEPLGQDDNLGDSVLRAAYIDALRGEGRQLHLQLEGQSSDYLTGLPLDPHDVVYTRRKAWLESLRSTRKPVLAVNAGEWTMRAHGDFPAAQRAGEMRGVLKQGGMILAAGLGVQNPTIAATVEFSPVFLQARLVSWRDVPSRDAAGFGDAAADWAFSLGTKTSAWAPSAERPLLAVTLRFDRPWPDERWLSAVRELASRTRTRIVTLAQVARDAPRAVRLAEVLGGEYLVAKSTSHADLDAHVRDVYSRSLAVVSDRAHALIIGATEGAFPVGSAADPQKISRMLDVAHLGGVTGSYDELADVIDALEGELPGLAPSIDAARDQLADLRLRIGQALSEAV